MERWTEIHSVITNDGHTLLLYQGKQLKYPTVFLDNIKNNFDIPDAVDKAFSFFEMMIEDRMKRENGTDSRCPYCSERVPASLCRVSETSHVVAGECPFCKKRVAFVRKCQINIETL